MSESAGHESGVARKARLVAGGAVKVEPLYPASRLLKSGVLEAEQVVAEAARIRREAEEEAKRIIEAAQAQADAVREEGFRRGVEQGMGEFAQMLGKIDGELEGLRKQFAVEVQRVALTFASFILKVEFELKPERIVEMVNTVFKSVRLYNRIRVHLHPKDAELVRGHEAGLLKQLPFATDVQFCADGEIERHGIRVETEMGTYDGSLQTQLKRLEEYVMAEIRKEGGIA